MSQVYHGSIALPSILGHAVSDCRGGPDAPDASQEPSYPAKVEYSYELRADAEQGSPSSDVSDIRPPQPYVMPAYYSPTVGGSPPDRSTAPPNEWYQTLLDEYYAQERLEYDRRQLRLRAASFSSTSSESEAPAPSTMPQRRSTCSRPVKRPAPEAPPARPQQAPRLIFPPHLNPLLDKGDRHPPRPEREIFRFGLAESASPAGTQAASSISPSPPLPPPPPPRPKRLRAQTTNARTHPSSAGRVQPQRTAKKPAIEDPSPSSEPARANASTASAAPSVPQPSQQPVVRQNPDELFAHNLDVSDEPEVTDHIDIRAVVAQYEEERRIKLHPTESAPRTNNDVLKRIKLMEQDHCASFFAAHHVICAGCNQRIATEMRWDLYCSGLWKKHKLVNCKALQAWGSKGHAPSEEELRMWQRRRSKCAKFLTAQYGSLLGKGKTSECVCLKLGLEIEAVQAHNARQAAKAAKA
ncbi:hypothetical protein HDZ31DRAFT_63421 [Schizophyllum fasciatum]